MTPRCRKGRTLVCNVCVLIYPGMIDGHNLQSHDLGACTPNDTLEVALSTMREVLALASKGEDLNEYWDSSLIRRFGS